MTSGLSNWRQHEAGQWSIALWLRVDDPTTLWRAAADSAMAAPDMTLDDVIDTIGPSDDPEIASCLAMLLDCGRFAGCEFEGLVCRAAPDKNGIFDDVEQA